MSEHPNVAPFPGAWPSSAPVQLGEQQVISAVGVGGEAGPYSSQPDRASSLLAQMGLAPPLAQEARKSKQVTPTVAQLPPATVQAQAVARGQTQYMDATTMYAGAERGEAFKVPSLQPLSPVKAAPMSAEKTKRMSSKRWRIVNPRTLQEVTGKPAVPQSSMSFEEDDSTASYETELAAGSAALSFQFNADALPFLSPQAQTLDSSLVGSRLGAVEIPGSTEGLHSSPGSLDALASAASGGGAWPLATQPTATQGREAVPVSWLQTDHFQDAQDHADTWSRHFSTPPPEAPPPPPPEAAFGLHGSALSLKESQHQEDLQLLETAYSVALSVLGPPTPRSESPFQPQQVDRLLGVSPPGRQRAALGAL